MIQEAYVSFEIAKLLKDKGFNETCYSCYEYFKSAITMYQGWPFEYKGEVVQSSDDVIPAPTLQMAIKWLREVHDVYIDVSIYVITKNMLKYNINVYYKKHKNDSMYLGTHLTKEHTKYEQACEAAVLYCLKNLI